MVAPVSLSRKRRYSEPPAFPSGIKGARDTLSSRARRVKSCPAFKEIPPIHQRTQLPISYAALQHPETTVGMDVAQPALSKRPDDFIDTARDEIRLFHFVVLDIYHAYPQGDFGVEPLKNRQLRIAAAGEFKHQMVRAQGIQERQQVAPESLLDRLSRVVAETDVHRLLGE